MYTEDGFKLSGSTSLQDTMSEKYTSYKSNSESNRGASSVQKRDRSSEPQISINYDEYLNQKLGIEPEIFEWKEEIDYYKKDKIPDLLERLGRKHSCKLSMNIYDESFFGRRQSMVFVFEGDEENLTKLAADYYVRMNKIETSHLLKKEYSYKELEIVESEESLIGTIIVHPFSNAKKIPSVIAKTLKVKCNITEKSNGFFRKKVIKFEAEGPPDELSCFKKIFQHYLVEDKSVKTKKLKM